MVDEAEAIEIKNVESLWVRTICHFNFDTLTFVNGGRLQITILHNFNHVR